MKRLIGMLLLFFGFPVLASGAPTSGLVAYYPFEGDANDESGNGNHGTVVGATLTTDRFGNEDSAYDFDGIGDWIRVEHSEELDLKTDLSVVAFIKYRSIAPMHSQIVYYGDTRGSHDPYLIYLNDSDQKLVFRTDVDAGSQTVTVESPETMEPGIWYFVAGTKENLSGKQKLKLYVNGDIVGQVETSGTINYDTSNMWLAIGAVDLGDWQNFDGVIDDVYIYNRALSVTEIEELYNDMPGHPNISLSHDFGVVDVGNASNLYAFMVTNTGEADLCLYSVSLLGIDPFDFSIESDLCSGETLLPQDTCAIDVVFEPESEGPKSATLAISSNDPDTQILQVALTGEGNALPPPPPGKRFCSTLGGGRFPFDSDAFRFFGTEGDEVTVCLEANPVGSGGGREAVLTLRAKIGWPYTKRTAPLPIEITDTLSRSGEYHIIVGQVWSFRGSGGYEGDYCLTLEGPQGVLDTFEESSSIE